MTLAELFKVSTSDLVNRANQLFEDLTTAKNEIKKVREKYIEAETKRLANHAKPVGKMNLIVSDMKDTDPETLKRIAITLTKNNPFSVVFFGGVSDKAYLVGAAGNEAIKAGIDVKEILGEAGHFIQGTGGGVAKVAQFGGPLFSGLGKALETCEESVERLSSP